MHLPLAVRCATPCLTTLHNRLDTPGLEMLYAEYRAHPLVSISESQRRPLPLANWLATIHHPLKIAAKVARKDRDYFAAEVEPRIDGSLIEFIGEIGEHEKTRFLGEALALLFPISWPEPFGLVMIEAMACGHTNHRTEPRLGAGDHRRGRHGLHGPESR